MVDIFVNGELAIFAICTADVDGDYTIRLWASLQNSSMKKDGQNEKEKVDEVWDF